jgi:hypothetical protein
MQVNAKTTFLSICMMLFLTLSLIACKPKNQSELYGTYVADYNLAKEKLTFNKDGTFIQEVTLKATSKVDVTEGTWTYDTKTGYVRFHENFMPVLNGFKELNPDYNQNLTSASLPAVKYLGCIRVEFAEGIYYKKTD